MVGVPGGIRTRVTAVKGRSPDRSRWNYKAAVALECPVKNRWECQGTWLSCTVLVPRVFELVFRATRDLTSLAVNRKAHCRDAVVAWSLNFNPPSVHVSKRCLNIPQVSTTPLASTARSGVFGEIRVPRVQELDVIDPSRARIN